MEFKKFKMAARSGCFEDRNVEQEGVTNTSTNSSNQANSQSKLVIVQGKQKVPDKDTQTNIDFEKLKYTM